MRQNDGSNVQQRQALVSPWGGKHPSCYSTLKFTPSTSTAFFTSEQQAFFTISQQHDSPPSIYKYNARANATALFQVCT
jgi:hypothetical protein